MQEEEDDEEQVEGNNENVVPIDLTSDQVAYNSRRAAASHQYPRV